MDAYSVDEISCKVYEEVDGFWFRFEIEDVRHYISIYQEYADKAKKHTLSLEECREIVSPLIEQRYVL